MGKKATKAADNMYYLARCEAAETNADFSSREKAAELVGIDRTRLARIELDTIVPYPEDIPWHRRNVLWAAAVYRKSTLWTLTGWH